MENKTTAKNAKTNTTATDANHQKPTLTAMQPNPKVPLSPAPSGIRPSASDALLQRADQVQDQKLMVVAICRGRDGQMVITPIDVEHDTDDLTPMTDEQMAARKLSDQAIRSAQGDMMKAFGALYEIYSRRLYRNQFRTFENFCFAMYGTHRINDALIKKVNARAKALKTDVNEGF